jgi:hypothetical protein
VERKITVQGIDKVLAFLPLFERSDTTLYEVRTDLSLFDPYVYSNEVDEFIEILPLKNSLLLSIGQLGRTKRQNSLSSLNY